jgi:prophage DNA circulation protein
MFREDAKEAAPIVIDALRMMLRMTSTKGRAGSDFRTACGDVIASCESLLVNDAIGPPLDNVFELARKAGISLEQMRTVRRATLKYDPILLGATLIKNALISFALATQSRIVSERIFRSRQDVDYIKGLVNTAFNEMEEVMADEMDQMWYRRLVELHAAVIYYLVETARPLPRMLGYRFADVISSLVISYKLYDTANRADELRAENKIVHPAFMQLTGRALSS